MNELKVVANDMLPVYENESGEKFVNAREIHEKLMSKRKFTDWLNTRLNNYGFEEGLDFFTLAGKSTGGRPSTEILFTLDTGKEVAMVENNEMGRAIRKYFIEVDKRYQQQKPQSHAEMLLMFAQQMVENEKKVNQLEKKLNDVNHRIDNFDKLDTIGDLQQRLNGMIRKYAGDYGLAFPQAWRNFKAAFNTAYRTNITMLIENYKLKHGLKNLTTPQYLSLVGRLEDAVRIADKLLNKGGNVENIR